MAQQTTVYAAPHARTAAGRHKQDLHPAALSCERIQAVTLILGYGTDNIVDNYRIVLRSLLFKETKVS